MSERFFVEQPIEGDQAILVGAEAHHLCHVLRARRGEFVTLFDGTGCEYRARIEAIARAHVSLSVLDKSLVDRELPFSLTLGVSLPRGDRQKWMVEKLSELGATRLVPLLAQRTVAEPGAAARERLRRAAIEAAKQCGRNRLLEIDEPVQLADFLAAASPAGQRWFLHPQTPPDDDTCGAESPSMPHSPIPSPGTAVVIAVGPEGGFTDEEFQESLTRGWSPRSLGPRILRIETAAIAITAQLAGSGYMPRIAARAVHPG
jgi:16S rRNA (uracil1498-N3)-methyltransferase